MDFFMVIYFLVILFINFFIFHCLIVIFLSVFDDTGTILI